MIQLKFKPCLCNKECFYFFIFMLPLTDGFYQVTDYPRSCVLDLLFFDLLVIFLCLTIVWGILKYVLSVTLAVLYVRDITSILNISISTSTFKGLQQVQRVFLGISLQTQRGLQKSINLYFKHLSNCEKWHLMSHHF